MLLNPRHMQIIYDIVGHLPSLRLSVLTSVIDTERVGGQYLCDAASLSLSGACPVHSLKVTGFGSTV